MRRSFRFPKFVRPFLIEQLETRRMLATITVDTLVDEQDGDIVLGDVSLRDAINLAANGDMINFSVSGVINLTLGSLEIDRELQIFGPGPDKLTIDGSGSDPTPNVDQGDGVSVFFINDGQDMNSRFVRLSGMTVTGGDVLGRGGGIHSDESLLLSNMVIEGNAAAGTGTINGRGGGIFAHRGSLTVRNSTVRNNFATQHGGGLRVDGIVTNVVNSLIRDNRASGEGGGLASVAGTGDVTALTNTTVSGNTAGVRGGGIWNSDGLTIVQHSTVTLNSTDIPGLGGGIGSNGLVAGFVNARTELYSSVVAGNIGSDIDSVTSAPPNVNTVVSNGYNVIGTGNALGSFNRPGDQINVTAPNLGSLRNNGGVTLTHAPRAGSPAIDRGDPNIVGGPDFDQRGEPFERIADGGVLGVRMDVGAVEFQTVPGLSLVVDTIDDELDTDYSAGDLSLREAAALANGSIGVDTISFDETVFAGPQTVTLAHGEIVLHEATSIEGPSQFGGETTLDAQFDSRIFNFAATSGDFSVTGLTLQNGRTTQANVPFGTEFSGGAIRSNTTGHLTIEDSVIRGNRTHGYLAAGAGIFSRGDVTLRDSTLSNNATHGDYGYGGAVASFANVTVERSTIRGNETNGASAYGGAISSYRHVDLIESTITVNATHGPGAHGGGIFANTGTTIANSTVAANWTSGNSSSGGAVASFGDVTLDQSTLSGNYTSGTSADGGGISTSTGLVTIAYSTLVNNRVDHASSNGGAIANTATSVVVSNSIVSANSAGGADDDIEAPNRLLSINHSLIGAGVAPDSATSGNNVVTDDPLLRPLGDFGGATPTHVPYSSSPAVDAGDPAVVAGVAGTPDFDQRGAPFGRVEDGDGNGAPRIDIGAIELPQRLACDFDGLGVCDIEDLDALVMDVASMNNDPLFDLSGDGMVNDDDVEAWLVVGGMQNPAVTGGNAFLRGDSNLDGVVDGQDFVIWNDHKFTATGRWSEGDWNADGVTDGQDFVMWNDLKFQASMQPSSGLSDLEDEDRGEKQPLLVVRRG